MFIKWGLREQEPVFTGPLVAAGGPSRRSAVHACGRFRGRFSLKAIKTQLKRWSLMTDTAGILKPNVSSPFVLLLMLKIVLDLTSPRLPTL